MECWENLGMKIVNCQKTGLYFVGTAFALKFVMSTLRITRPGFAKYLGKKRGRKPTHSEVCGNQKREVHWYRTHKL